MDELIALLQTIRSDVNYEECKELIDGGVFGSFEIIQTIAGIEEKFGVSIMPDDFIPENFNSAQAMWALIERLRGAAGA